MHKNLWYAVNLRGQGRSPEAKDSLFNEVHLVYLHVLICIKTSDQLHSGPAVSAFDSLRPLIPNIIELKTHLQCVTLLGLSGKAQKIHTFLRIFCVIDHVYNVP